MFDSTPTLPEIIAAVFFACAIIHTFFSGYFRELAHKFPEGSIAENIFHLIGEVEVVFGLWAALFIGVFALITSPGEAVAYAESLTFTEAIFVFVIMTTAATKPIIEVGEAIIYFVAKIFGYARSRSELIFYISCLSVGPLLGSLITEPAAMTLTALIIGKRYFTDQTSTKFKYCTIGTLFVNISIGGALTPFAAPPVLMVASKWNWDFMFMLQSFGWKATAATIINSLIAGYILRNELKSLKPPESPKLNMETPLWLKGIHLFFLFLIVIAAHHPVIFIGLFLLFLGVTVITNEYQSELPLKQSLLVAFFLGGLVVLGGLQQWWLNPVLQNLSDSTLFVGTAALTAFTDNAALTYLGSQLPNLSDNFKYSLVAGAITGGGLTVIANAPNPAGFAILQDKFGDGGIHPMKLFFSALIPTLISAIFLWPY